MRAAGCAPPECALAVLIAVYLCDYIDRYLVNLLAEPIRLDLGLTDTATGLLQTAFFAFHAAFALPIATYVETVGDRVPVLTCSILLWTLFAAGSGLAPTFGSLLLCRVMVGVGEAVVTPVAQTMIFDLYPPGERVVPMGVYFAAAYFGHFAAFLSGGFITAAFTWRTAFLAMALATGAPVAALTACALRDPRRAACTATSSVPSMVVGGGRTPPSPGCHHFAHGLGASLRAPGYVLLQGGNGLAAGVVTAAAAWSPSLLARTHGMSIEEIGVFLALANGLLMGVGAIAWSAVANQLCAAHGASTLIKVPATGLLLGGLLLAAATVVESKRACLALLALGLFALASWVCVIPCLLALTPPGAKAIAASVSSLTAALAGSIAAPAVGALSDAWSDLGAALRVVMLSFAIPGALLLATAASRSAHDGTMGAFALQLGGPPPPRESCRGASAGTRSAATAARSRCASATLM